MKGLFFDLDGTILDTLADIGNACNAALKRHNFPGHRLSAYRQMVGDGFPTLVRRALPQEAHLDAEQLDSLITEARAYYAEHMTEETMPYPGMTTALSMLMSAGCVLAVLSNKPDELCKRLTAHFFPSIQFAAVEGAKPDMPLKPDPAALLGILKRFDIEKDDSCFIGDSNVDMITAINAGVMPVGVAWGFRDKAELNASGAKIILDEPWELGELINF